MEYGGMIERGRVKEAAGGKYVVESLERKGIVSPPIPAAGGATYAAGDMVLFVLFPDGTGMIFAAAQAID